MGEVAGDIARTMAAAPAKGDKAKRDMLTVLGLPSFVMGTDAPKAQTEGWGSNKKPKTDGSTYQTAATVIFKPFKTMGLDLPIEGRIYKYVDAGVAKPRYEVSISALKPARGDAASVNAVEALKVQVWEAFVSWHKAQPVGETVSARKGFALD